MNIDCATVDSSTENGLCPLNSIGKCIVAMLSRNLCSFEHIIVYDYEFVKVSLKTSSNKYSACVIHISMLEERYE